MANTPNFSTLVPVTIPTLSDVADIETAFKIYHNGSQDGNTVFDNSIAGNLLKKAPLLSPVFSGNITFATGATIALPDNSVTTGVIANGAITNDDINSAAQIAQTKIAGLSDSLNLKANVASPTFTGTVTASTITATTINGNLVGIADKATSAVNYLSGGSTNYRKIYVSSTSPSSPLDGDVWIVIS